MTNDKQSFTKLGLYLRERSINRSEVSRKTGLSPYRLSQLSINEKAHLRADELYLIARAIGVDPAQMFIELHKFLDEQLES